MQSILVLEDDADLRGEICEALEEEGFAVHACGTIKRFRVEFARTKPELVLMDLGLPDGKGTDLIREMRAKSNVGILVLSGRRDEADRIIALEFGADDFVVKPCSPREVLARINAILRRTQAITTTPGDEGPNRIEFDGYLLDRWAMELRNPEGDVISLTTAEFELLDVFVQRPQRVLTRRQLTDLLRGADWEGYDRAIDGLVSRLRKKIPGRCVETPPLKTVHGTGYIFSANVAKI